MFKNIAYLYVIQVLRLFLPLALLSILTKILSSEQYGVYIYTLASAAWLSIFVEYGFNVSATRRIAASVDDQSTGEVILQTQTARWILTCLTLLFLAWATLVSEVFAAHSLWALSAWLLGVITGLTPTYYYQAKGKLHIVALLEAAGGLITLFAVLQLIHGPEDFWRLCWILVLVRLVVWQVLDRRMLSDHCLKFRNSFRISQGMVAIKDGWKIFLLQAAASLYTSFNVVLLGNVSTAYAVAVFGTCDRLIRAGLSFISQATSAIFPQLNAMKVDHPTVLGRARRMYLVTFIAGSVACLPLIWWLAPIISNKLFHNTLPDIIMVLRIMALVVPAIAISNVLAYHYLVVDHKEHIINWVVISTAPLSIVTGVLLSREYGANGMAVSWVAIEWFVTIALSAIIYLRYKRSK